MIRQCIICGKDFDASPRALVCSGPCRLEQKKRYNKHYRETHLSSIRVQKAKWYASTKGVAFIPKPEPEPEFVEVFKPDRNRDYKGTILICSNSYWGKKWLRKDRLEQIVSLSTELSKLGIEKLSYGELSAIEEFDTKRYNSLLSKVVKAKEGVV